jgi:hypothetical protein
VLRREQAGVEDDGEEEEVRGQSPECEEAAPAGGRHAVVAEPSGGQRDGQRRERGQDDDGRCSRGQRQLRHGRPDPEPAARG